MLETKPKEHLCPACGKATKRIQNLYLLLYINITNEVVPLFLLVTTNLRMKRKKECSLMLLYNDNLRLTHYLKEWFYRICQNPRYSKQRKDFLEWISTAEQAQHIEFERCAATYRHWCKEILNAFKYSHISNGPTERFNNKIKVLKRTSYGIRNFDHFKTRILLNMH